jgi:hypothetical protein
MGLDYLQELPSLRALDLRGIKVTPRAVAKLQQTLPKLNDIER